jgi:IS605 OrfB family transposase
VTDHEAVLEETQHRFNDAATWVAAVCWEEHITNTNTAHHRVYGPTRARFGLGAQLAVCARAKAMEAIKAVKSQDAERMARWRKANARRRKQGKHEMLVDPDWKIGGEELVWRMGVYYLHVTQTTAAPEEPPTSDVLGIDLGICNVATDSQGEPFTGTGVRKKRAQYVARRSALQRVGTRSAKRRPKRMSGRERRWMREVNHTISKTLVKKVVVSRKALALEDLTGIREGEVTVRREQRYERHCWAFYQLRQFLTYKAAQASVPVYLVDPAYTSQTCSRCGYCDSANRQSQSSFKCKQCGFCCHADYNAAQNIAQAGRQAAYGRNGTSLATSPSSSRGRGT